MIRRWSNVHFPHPHAQKAPVNDFTDYMTCYVAFDNTQAQFPRPTPKSIVSVERSAPVGDTFDLCSSRCWGLFILLSSQATSVPQAADSSPLHGTYACSSPVVDMCLKWHDTFMPHKYAECHSCHHNRTVLAHRYLSPYRHHCPIVYFTRRSFLTSF